MPRRQPETVAGARPPGTVIPPGYTGNLWRPHTRCGVQNSVALLESRHLKTVGSYKETVCEPRAGEARYAEACSGRLRLCQRQMVRQRLPGPVRAALQARPALAKAGRVFLLAVSQGVSYAAGRVLTPRCSAAGAATEQPTFRVVGSPKNGTPLSCLRFAWLLLLVFSEPSCASEMPSCSE